MAKRIEEAFNDCFERLTSGESLDSCLTSYPEFALELDAMLRTAFDIKRRAYPVQPRPEFRYWSRVRLQGIQDYVSRQPAQDKPSSFNLRRNLAFSMAALLVFVIATSGTVAASSAAQPDEPLYGVKMAVEQAQVTFTLSDVDKAELYAQLAEKRANEIMAMADRGKTDQLEATATRMDFQLEQAEHFITKYEAANTDVSSITPSITSSPSPSLNAPAGSAAIPPADNDSTVVLPEGQQDNFKSPVKILRPPSGAATNINRANAAINASTAKSISVLQNALDKAPDSIKPSINRVIERTKKANERSEQQSPLNQEQKPFPSDLRNNKLPDKPLPDTLKPDPDKRGSFTPTDKPKYTPPVNRNLPPNNIR